MTSPSPPVVSFADDAVSSGVGGPSVGTPPRAGGRSPRLHERIAAQLRSQITTGALPPHGRIPSEAALCASFRVSRITVRQALGTLQSDGLIVRQQGKGSFVAGPKPGQDLGRLTGLAEALGSQGRAVTNRVLGIRTLAAAVDVSDRLRLALGAPVVELRRVRCVDALPVSLEISYFPGELAGTLTSADLVNRDVYLVLEEDARLDLAHADWRIDAVAADPALAHALEIAPGSALMRVERLAFTRTGRPVDFEYLYYRGDAFQYHLRTERRPGPPSTPTGDSGGEPLPTEENHDRNLNRIDPRNPPAGL